MYLAGILALCILFAGSPFSHATKGPVILGALAASADLSAHGLPQQDSGQSEPAKPPASQPAPPPDNAPPAEAQPAKPTPPPAQTPLKKPAKPHVAAIKKPASKSSGQTPSQSSQTPTPPTQTATNSAQTPSKKVVREGGTGDPETQLAPGITLEQASRQRQTTNELLASTDAALQRLSGQSLTSDQQETVAQIRSFVQQSKAANKDGDLQLAYKLAVKAHLLSDGVSKE